MVANRDFQQAILYNTGCFGPGINLRKGMSNALVGIPLAKADNGVVEQCFLGGCYPGDTVGQFWVA